MAISFAPTNLSSDQFVQQSMGRTLLNDCLADAMIYVGEARSMLQRQMWAAVLAALCHGSSARDSAALKATVEAERTPIFIITASLGSKILYDTLWKISKQRTSPRVGTIFARAVQLFMHANQIPVLSFAAPIDKDNRLASTESELTTDTLDALFSRW
jgi:hypothetical protein